MYQLYLSKTEKKKSLLRLRSLFSEWLGFGDVVAASYNPSTFMVRITQTHI